MRIIMMGTGPFAVPVFQSLLDSHHDVVGLITRPVPPPKRRQKTPPNPMRDLGTQVGIAIFEPADVNDSETVSRLSAWQLDLMVVCDYGQILSKETLGTARLGGVNLHGSILPRFRGAAPVNWALLQGDQETGVTVIHMTPRLDAGNSLVISRLAIDPDENAEQLESRLSALGPQAVDDAIAMLETWDGVTTMGEPQPEELATRAPRLKKSDGLVDWSQSAQQIKNQIRAFVPWPGSYTFWNRSGGQPLRAILNQVSVVTAAELETSDPMPNQDAKPGAVVAVEKNRLVVQTGDGLLSIIQIQPSGKRALEIGEYLRGYPMRLGDQFDSSSS